MRNGRCSKECDFMARYTENLCVNDSYFCTELDRVIINHIKKIKAFLSTLSFPFNLYLTGSLARKEPSAHVLQNKVVLDSDFDWVLVTETWEECIYLYRLGITDKISIIDPEIHDSVIIDSVEKLKNLKSFVAADLINEIHTPIMHSIKLTDAKLPNYTLTCSDYFDKMIASISVLVSSKDDSGASILYKHGEKYYQSKLTMACITAITNSLNLKTGLSLLDQYVSLTELTKSGWILARERQDYALYENVNNTLINISTQKMFGCSVEQLVNELLSYPLTNLKHTQGIFLAAYYMYWGTEDIQQTIESVLKKYRIQPGLLMDRRKMRQIRLEYLRQQNYINLGHNLIPDLKGVYL